jgi:Protein of unknown function (DUF2510)
MSMSTTAATALAGWYAVGGGLERYWDGSAWTEQVRAVPPYLQRVRRSGLLATLADFRDPTPITPN